MSSDILREKLLPIRNLYIEILAVRALMLTVNTNKPRRITQIRISLSLLSLIFVRLRSSKPVQANCIWVWFPTFIFPYLFHGFYEFFCPFEFNFIRGKVHRLKSHTGREYAELFIFHFFNEPENLQTRDPQLQVLPEGLALNNSMP